MATGGLRDTFINSILTDAVISILRRNTVASLEQKLLQNTNLGEGELLWIEQDFYFKGASKAKTEHEAGRRPAYASFYCVLARYGGLRLGGEFNAEHLFGDSSITNLSGRKTVFLFAYIKAVSGREIVLRPVFIGHKMIPAGRGFSCETDRLQIDVDDIDEFKEVRLISHRGLDINLNKYFPEKDIKKWFAEILFETNVPKDWAGEHSDLFTNHLHVGGKRYNAAFLLKGPARFEPMTVKNLGKNGDQIVRLYNEPADVYILQHCHKVKPEIHKTMKAFSGNFTTQSRYCIIDGEDTLRILKAYKKIS